MFSHSATHADAMTRNAAIDLLVGATEAMHARGQPLMRRVLPADVPVEQWAHYPADDVVNGPAGSRYFYHCHPPEEREWGEHGHFHLFLARSAMPHGHHPMMPAPPTDEPRADIVHIAALSVDLQGLPIRWFTVNRWVTDETLFHARTIAAALGRFDLRGPVGDPLVNDWLTAMVALSRPMLIDLLKRRDTVLMDRDPGGESRSVEVPSDDAIDLVNLLDD